MTVLNETTHAAEFLVSEGNGNISRDVVTLISGQNLKAGTVLGKITASSKFTQFDQDAVTGEETAVAVLYAAVDATGGDKPCTVVDRLAEVAGGALIWPGDIEAGEKTAAIADLDAVNIRVR